MPTTSETTGRAASGGEDTNGALDSLRSAEDSLRNAEATGEEAIAETIHAFTELLRSTVPVAMSQPARFVDLTFELAQQAMNFQRRFFIEVLSGLQRVITETWAELEGDRSFKGQGSRGSERRGRTTRQAA